MREDIKKTTVYPFKELSEEAQEKAIEHLWDLNVDYEWWEFVFEDAKEIGKLLGITIDNIYFSGFSSQGDGACFEGSYSYAKESTKRVKEYVPTDERLYRIARDLQKIQRRYFYKLSANVKHRGHYSHEYCTEIDVSHADYFCVSSEANDGIAENLRDFMRWIYRRLEEEYEYFTSKEAIIETINANEYEFTEDGKLYY